MTRSISIFEVSDAREDSFLLDAVNFVVLRILSDAERLKLWQLPRRRACQLGRICVHQRFILSAGGR